MRVGGNTVFYTNGAYISSQRTTGYNLAANQTATTTNPVFNFYGDEDTGIGANGSNGLALIVSGTFGLMVTHSAGTSNPLISGSVISTGSFGHGHFGGNVGIGTPHTYDSGQPTGRMIHAEDGTFIRTMSFTHRDIDANFGGICITGVPNNAGATFATGSYLQLWSVAKS